MGQPIGCPVKLMPKVNQGILRWARETAGLTPEQAAEKLQVRPARGLSPLNRLTALERGEEDPTRRMLAGMARVYRRPLVVFYMSRRPRRGDRGQDFRTLPEGRNAADEALLDALIRDVRARQGMVRAVIEDEDEAEVCAFVGSAKIADGVQALVASIQDRLGLSRETLYTQASPFDAFSLLRRHVESIGVFVLLKGDLGSYHSAMDVETFRGLALADSVAPFVVINDQDSKTAWSFTLIHELAHLWLGQTGVSGERTELGIERFCNDVAGQFLLPAEELDQLPLASAPDAEALRDLIADFAGRRNLSGPMVAYRLYRDGRVKYETWSHLSDTFREKWFQERDTQRQKSRQQEGGPNFYVVRAHRVGSALLNLVERMLGTGALTTSKAGKVLGVKPKQVEALLRQKVGRRLA